VGLPKSARLRASADFRRTIRQGVRVNGRAFVLFARHGSTGAARLGLSVSRRVGGAVVRNRIKRRLREAFRQPQGVAPQMDLVLVAKPEAASCSQSELALEFWRRLGRLPALASRAKRG
jgi:ribonuclease P protein component